MKRVISLVIVMMMLVSTAFAEGLLPQMGEVLGVEMPSLSSVLLCNPDNSQTLSDGSEELVYSNVSDSDFQAFSIYLQESGCEMPEYNTTADAFTATISKEGKSFYFSYNLNDLTATLTYPTGTRAEKAIQAEVGSIVTFGFYEQDNDAANGMEPIEWIVLERQDDELLLISKYILELKKFNNVKKFNQNPEKANWAACDLRSWLNNDFLNKAFSGNQEYIVDNTVFTPDVKNWDGTETVFGGGETIDKVYLLSKDEAESYFQTNKDRSTTGTEYVTAKLNHGGNLSWFLRSVNGYTCSIDAVDGENWYYPNSNYGYVTTVNVNVAYLTNNPMAYIGADDSGSLPGIGVRPVIRIKTAGLTSKSNSAETKAYETLSKGTKGEQVKVLQQALIEQGYLSGKADGDFGNMTAEAIKKAQSAFGMEATGVADSAFQNELYSR